MFTGLVEEVGKVLWIRATEHGIQLEITAAITALQTRIGDSIAVNGCCLTVTAHRSDQVTFDLLNETLDRTNLGQLRRDTLVNLERSLRADGRIGGHFVQGHIDGAPKILSFEQRGKDYRLEIEMPPQFAQYVVSKGAVAIDGISLTVAEVHRSSFAVWIIPHTKRATNLQSAQRGDRVNLEFDILAKYVERMLRQSRPDKTGA
jgi:riboflavin synthase